MASGKDSQLFQLLQLLQFGWRHFGQLQQEIASISVQTDVLEEDRLRVGQQAFVPVADIRNRAAAEIQGAALFIADHFDASRILELRVASGWGWRASP